MLVAFLSTTQPPYVTGFEACTVPRFNEVYKNIPNVLFVSVRDLNGKALTNFIANYDKYFVNNGKLVLDTTK